MSLVKKKGLGIEICFVKSLSLDLVFIDLTHLSRERKKKREVEGGVVKEGNFGEWSPCESATAFC